MGSAPPLIGIGVVLQPPAGESWTLHAFMAGRLLPCVLWAACARLQELGERAGAGTRPARRRHSPLPYLAAAAAQLLMIVLLLRAGLPLQLAGGVIGVSLVIALVIARQLVTFTDVDTLVTEVSRQEQRFRALVRHASDVTLVVGRDGLLTYASPALQRVLGDTDLVARLGGDEFAVILHPLSSTGTAPAEAEAMAARIREAIGRPMRVAGQDLRVGAGVGVATGPSATAGSLLEIADAAMYETKRGSRVSR